MTFLTRRTVLAGAAAIATPRLHAPGEARSFEAFVAGLWPAASAAGAAEGHFDRAFAGCSHNPRVIELSQRTAGVSPHARSYVDVRASTSASTMAARRSATMAPHSRPCRRPLRRAGRDSSAPSAGNETSYGHRAWRALRHPGHGDPRAAGRSAADFFRREMVAALRILQAGDTKTPEHDRLLGRRHGAMSSSCRPASTPSPSISPATAAATSGPPFPTPWARRPNTCAATAGRGACHGASRSMRRGSPVPAPAQELDAWAAAGVRRIGGGPMSGGAQASLWKPAGEGGPHLLVTSNLIASSATTTPIPMRWRSATSATAFKGAGRFSKPWPPGRGRSHPR